ncbi:MAG: tRNA pseudouridine synthase A [Polyangiaceae bacterium]
MTSRAAARPASRRRRGEGPRHTYRATIAYDGSAFAGFREQRGAETVEGRLLVALRELMPEITRLACGGRTDRGVHATGQVVSFWSRGALPLPALAEVIDGAAPGRIALVDLRPVPRRFHAGFSAMGRRYCYVVSDAEGREPERLDAMLRALVGERCFSAFARDTEAGKSTVRRLYAASVRRAGALWGPDALRFDLHASGFLRRQVRVTVATALREAAAGSPADVLVALAATGDRRATAPPADPGGLYLTGIDYPADPSLAARRFV